MDISPLCYKVAYKVQMVVEGQGHFAKCLLLRIILPVVECYTKSQKLCGVLGGGSAASDNL